MTTDKRLRLALAAGLIVILGCGGSSSEAQDDVQGTVDTAVEQAKADAEPTSGSVAGAPRVSDRYQGSIDRGWRKALDGESPANACAGLKGRVMGTGATEDPAALEALYACNVLLPVRYFETQLDRIEAGDATCADLMTSMMTQLSAMTLSIDSVQGMMDAMEGDDSEGFAKELGAATLEEGLTDPKRAIKDRLDERVREICPDEADFILH